MIIKLVKVRRSELMAAGYESYNCETANETVIMGVDKYGRLLTPSEKDLETLKSQQ